VVGPEFPDHAVPRDDPEAVLGDLLEAGLVVLVEDLDGARIEQGHKEPADEIAHGVEAPVAVNGGDNRLERVCQQRALHPAAGDVLAAAEKQVVAQVKLPGQPGQGLFVDDGGADLGEIPFRAVRVLPHQHVADAQGENGIAEKLEPLVVLLQKLRVLVRVGAVREGAIQKGRVPEPVPQGLLEGFEPHSAVTVHGRPVHAPSRPPRIR